MFSLELVKERIKEITSGVPQRELGEKLGMTQGNISRILGKNQMPQLDVIYKIAEEYHVSADWLLGLSENREVLPTYASAVEILVEMERCGNKMRENHSSGDMDICIHDLLLKELCMKGVSLQRTDNDSYKKWVKDKLVEFKNKPLLWAGIWEDDVIAYYLDKVAREDEMVSLYYEAKKREDELAEFAEGTEDIVPYKLDEK